MSGREILALCEATFLLGLGLALVTRYFNELVSYAISVLIVRSADRRARRNDPRRH